jgi:hypothetical protein
MVASREADWAAATTLEAPGLMAYYPPPVVRKRTSELPMDKHRLRQGAAARVK